MSFIQRFQATHNLPELRIGDLLEYTIENGKLRYARILYWTDEMLWLNFNIPENSHDPYHVQYGLSSEWAETTIDSVRDSVKWVAGNRSLATRIRYFLINNKDLVLT